MPLHMLRALCSLLVPGPNGNGRWSGPYLADGGSAAGATPPSAGGDTAAAADTDTDAADERTYTESEHKAEIERLKQSQATAFVKLRKENTGLKERLDALEKTAQDKADAGKSNEEKLKDRLDKAESEWKTRIEEAEKRAETERVARHEALIGHAIQSEISKRGLLEPELIEAYMRRNLTVSDEGRVVRKDADGIETDLDRAFEEFCKTHKGVVPASASGSGTRGGAPKTGKKAFGEMSRGELEAAAEADLQAMRGQRTQQRPL